MIDLLDIAPPALSAETIDIRGKALKVSGIGADHWAELYARCPKLKAVVSGKGDAAAHPIELFEAQVALIATGLGAHGDAGVEQQITDRLTLPEQLALVQAIVRLSLPGHVMRPLMRAAGANQPAAKAGKAPATK